MEALKEKMKNYVNIKISLSRMKRQMEEEALQRGIMLILAATPQHTSAEYNSAVDRWELST